MDQWQAEGEGCLREKGPWLVVQQYAAWLQHPYHVAQRKQQFRIRQVRKYVRHDDQVEALVEPLEGDVGDGGIDGGRHS